MRPSSDPTIQTHLKNCSLKQLTQIHGYLLTCSHLRRSILSSLLLRRATELASMDFADLLFSAIEPHVLTYNAMIRGYAYNGPYDKSLHLFDEMPQRGLKPNDFTYPSVLDACARLGDFWVGNMVHCQVVKCGFDGVASIGSSLLNFYVKMGRMADGERAFEGLATKSVGLWNRMISEYAKVGDLGSARRLFDGMPERDAVSWNSMLSGYVKNGELESARVLFWRMPEKNVVAWSVMVGAVAGSGDLGAARRLFDEMPEKNVVCWNCMLSSYTQHGRFKQALDLFLRMLSVGVAPDGFTFVAALSACAHLGDLRTGKWVYLQMVRDGLQLSAKLGTALLEMYAKCGDIDRAFSIFIKMIEKDIFCWNVMIKALAMHGRTEDAMKLFVAMKREGLRLNDFTFMSVLFACSHGGLVEEGRRTFRAMEKDFNIRPKIQHFGCLIDLLSRNGQLEEAHQVMKEMPYEPDVAVWGALLGGYRVRNDLKSAEKTMERVMELETSEAGVYVLLSNIYATSSQWNKALITRERMEEKRIWKTTGSSSVLEADNMG